MYEKDKNGGLNVFDSPSKSPFTNNVKLFSGSGGLLSTTNDYLIFCQMLLNGGTFNNQRIIKNSTLNLMLEDHSNELKYSDKSSNFGLTKPGEIIHEVGTTRMGNDSKTSVVNEFEQLHDVSNVFVVDAGPFVSQADKNPTWTIMALAWRSSDYIIDQFKKQNF